jgi:hypothetical protein
LSYPAPEETAMTWEAMTIDEYAAFLSSTGMKVVKVQDTWWTEARPFFFRPLFPFAEITPQFKRYPVQALVGGVLHLVPSDVPGNSNMHLFMYDRLDEYSLGGLNTKQRWIVRKGMDNFTARRITDLNQFVEEGCSIYESFYNRTRYFYKRERTNKAHFYAWAKPIFQQPKVVITGAYHKEKLAAIDISYQVEDIIIDDVFFSDSESQPLRVTDFLVHTLRESARSSQARLIFRGFPTGKQSLDVSKLTRGCKILKMPAYCKINPLALYVGKAFMNDSYRKLIAITSFTDNGKPNPAIPSKGEVTEPP